MLTLTNPLTIEGFTVYHDDENEIEAINKRIDATLAHDPIAHPGGPTGTPGDGDKPKARRFYVLPKTPKIAVDERGKPIFSMIVYRRDDTRIDPEKGGDVGGGILTFTVELAIPEEAMKKIHSRLRVVVWGADADDNQDIELTYVPFIDGKVAVAIAAEGTGDPGTGEFVTSAVGTGKVSGIGANRKAVMVKLTQSGAALMSNIDKLRVLPINVQYELSFEYRLLGVTMRVWCDVTSSYHLLQEVFHERHEEDSGYLGTDENQVHTDKITSVTELFVRNKTAGVEVVPETSLIDQDTLLALEKFGQDMLSKELEKIQDAKPPPADMDRSYLEKYYSDASAQLNMRFDRRMVLTRFYNPSANIENVFDRHDVDQLIAFVDLKTEFFALLKVPIRVNADFTKLPLSSVVVTLTYESERPGGHGRETVVKSFDFADGGTIQTFLTYANSLGLVEYEVEAAVHYKDSQEPYVFRRSGIKDTFLVVDVGTMGLIAVDVGLGLYDADKFPTATVSVRYKSRALGRTVEETFVLNKDKPNQLWTAIIREQSSGIYEYKVDWLRKADGAILEGQWTSAQSLRLRLDAPVPDHMAVSVLSTGNFKEERDQLVQVVASLRYEDPENDYIVDGQLNFSDEKQLQVWTIDLRNRELRDYKYRWTNVYKGGLVKEFPEGGGWLPGKPGFLTVGEMYDLEVTLYPYLLTFGDREKLVKVDMMYREPERGIEIVDSFIFNKENNKPAVWRARTGKSGAHTYQFNVTYFSATGEPRMLPTQTSNNEAVILTGAPAS